MKRTVIHYLSWKDQWPSNLFLINDRLIYFWPMTVHYISGQFVRRWKVILRYFLSWKIKTEKYFAHLCSWAPVLFTTSLSSSSTLIIHQINRLERTRLWIKNTIFIEKSRFWKSEKFEKSEILKKNRKLKQWRINFDNMDHVLWNIFYERGHKSFIFSRISELEPGIQGPRPVSSSSAKFRPNPPDRENPKHYLLWF